MEWGYDDYILYLRVIIHGQLEEVEEYLTLYPEYVDVPDRLGFTLLHYATCSANYPMIKILKAIAGPTLMPLNPDHDWMMNEPITSTEILEIRYRIYFQSSLLSRLLYLI